jgi:hypothetical protein
VTEPNESVVAVDVKTHQFNRHLILSLFLMLCSPFLL